MLYNENKKIKKLIKGRSPHSCNLGLKRYHLKRQEVHEGDENRGLS